MVADFNIYVCLICVFYIITCIYISHQVLDIDKAGTKIIFITKEKREKFREMVEVPRKLKA
jgi:hypothetical protein